MNVLEIRKKKICPPAPQKKNGLCNHLHLVYNVSNPNLFAILTNCQWNFLPYWRLTFPWSIAFCKFLYSRNWVFLKVRRFNILRRGGKSSRSLYHSVYTKLISVEIWRISNQPDHNPCCLVGQPPSCDSGNFFRGIFSKSWRTNIFLLELYNALLV